MRKYIYTILVVAILMVQASGAFAEGRKIALKPRRLAFLAGFKGAVEWKDGAPGSDWASAAEDTALSAGSTVRTGKDSSAVIMINGDSGDAESVSIELDSESRISIVEMAVNASTGNKSSLLSLELGKADVKAKNLRKGSVFEVKTPTSVISAQGSDSSFRIQVERSE